MTDNPRSRAWFRLAVIYFALAIALGIAMGASGDHTLLAVHAHLNLLGWVSMTLFGLIGMVYPTVTEGRAATCQFWLYNSCVPVMLAALTARLKGLAMIEPLIGVASVGVGIAVALFAWQLLGRLGEAPSRAGTLKTS